MGESALPENAVSVDAGSAIAGSASPRLTVVGGSVIGMTAALVAADAGFAVTVLDPGDHAGAGWVAGGMLGCLGEGDPAVPGLAALTADSVTRWPTLLDRLHRSGAPPIRVADETLLVAGSRADKERIDDEVAFIRSAVPGSTGRVAELSAAELRDLEPGLATGICGGYRVVGEGAVDNRALLAALRRELGAAGTVFDDRRVGDLAEISRDQSERDQVLIAAGLGSADLWPPRAAAACELRGEKGEIVRLRRGRWSVPGPSRVIRGRWHGRPIYLVPRGDGVVVGATQYEADSADDVLPEMGGAADLLADAGELMPGLRSFAIAEVAAGVRPSSPDGLPLVRRLDAHTIAAVGHGRNGVVLAPWTAARVLELLAGSGAGDAAGARSWKTRSLRQGERVDGTNS